MASRWLSSRQSGWGDADRSPNPAQRIVAIGVVVLIVDMLLGVGLTKTLSGGDDVPENADSAIANPAILDMKTAPKTADGAARAVTSYITGFPSVALMASLEQRDVLDEILSKNADPNLRQQLVDTLATARSRLVGSGALDGTLSARLIVTPASYKVDMLAPDRARVQVWFMQVFVDAKNQTAESSWATNDIQVQYTDHWRLASYVGKGGPTPPLVSETSTPSPYSDVVRVFNGFKAFRYATAQPSVNPEK